MNIVRKKGAIFLIKIHRNFIFKRFNIYLVSNRYIIQSRNLEKVYFSRCIIAEFCKPASSIVLSSASSFVGYTVNKLKSLRAY